MSINNVNKTQKDVKDIELNRNGHQPDFSSDFSLNSV